MAKKLRADYGINAMVLEVERRRNILGLHNYSYGKLIADTTPEERAALKEQYRKNFHKAQKGGTRSAFLESSKEAEEEICRKNKQTGE